MSLNTSPVSSLLKSAVHAYAAALLIEALAPRKISTVSHIKGVKDLTIIKFIYTYPYLLKHFTELAERALKEEPIRMGESVKETIKQIIQDPKIRTNTALGYLILATPAAYVVFRHIAAEGSLAKPVEKVIKEGGPLIKDQLQKEPGEDLYEGIRLAKQKHLGIYYGTIPDIAEGEVPVSVWEVLQKSSYDDQVSNEVVRNYPITLETYRKLLQYRESELLEGIRETHKEILSRYPDTLVTKTHGYPTAALLKAVAQKEVNAELWSEWIRKKGINPGTTSDIIAAAVALAEVEKAACSSNSVRHDHD